jgi:hypothetical protein
MFSRHLVAFVIFVLLYSGSLNGANAAPYLVGLSNVDITPGTSKHLMGYSYASGVPERVAEPGTYQGDAQYSSVGLSIRAVYIALPDGTDPIVLVSVDTSHICPMDTDFARDPSAYAIPFLTRERILISAIHTHSSVASCDNSVRFLADVQTADAQPFSDWRANVLRPKLRQAVALAYDNRDLANLRFMRNKADIGVNRRVGGTTSDMTDQLGTAVVSPNGYDHTLDVVEIYRDDNSRKGVLFFYGAHPVILGAGPFPDGKHHYHPDYPGVARKKIEDATAASDIAIFFQAAGGDVNGHPALGGYAAMRQKGEELGQRVLDMLAGAAQPANSISGQILPSQGPNNVYSRVWPVHLQTAVGTDRLGGGPGEPLGLASPATSSGSFASGDWFRWADFFCNGTNGHGGGNPRCGNSPKGTPATTLDTEVQTFQIGNWRVAGLSHDLVGLWGVELRQHWPSQWVSVVGYMNRLENYLVTSSMVDFDDQCWSASSSCGSYEGYAAQFLTGNPAPWATYATTGGQFDLDAEIHNMLRLARSRANVALASNGGVVTASSTTDSNVEYPGQGLNFPPSGVNNGDRKGLNWEHGGGWRDGTDGFPDWIQVEFTGVKTIDEIDVFTIQDNYMNPAEPTQSLTFSSWGITAFDVQYWNGSQWVVVPSGSVTGNNNVWRRFTFTPVTTTKVRVSINNALAGRSRVVELEAWGTPVSRANVALAANGGVATASSTTAPEEYPGLGLDFPPSGVNNGDRKGMNWEHGGGWRDGTDGFPDWIQVEFTGVKTIDEIDVFTIQDTYADPAEPNQALFFSSYGITAFDAQYWDGAQWVTVPGGSVTGNNKVWRRFLFAPVATSKIRVLVYNAAAGHSRVVELEAY